MFNPQKPLMFSENFTFDQNLHEVATYPDRLRERISFILNEMFDDEEVEERVRHLSEIGVLFRILRDLDAAETHLGEALELIQQDELEPRWFVIHGTRLANVWQWQKRFEESNPMFNELIAIAKSDEGCSQTLHFVFQHAGKNLFDQRQYQKALEMFEQALALRRGMNDSGLIESSEFAIEVTMSRLQKSY